MCEPKIYDVFQVCLEYNTQSGELTEYMQQLMKELIAALDTHHSVAPQHLLTLLKLFLACKQKHAKHHHPEEKETTVHEEKKSLLASVLLSHYNKKKEWKDTMDQFARKKDSSEVLTDSVAKDMEDLAIDKEKLEKEIGDSNNEEENGPIKEEIPRELQVVVDVMERCCFLLHSKERSVCLVLLDTLELGCEAIAQHENTQLPVLHKIWKPLMLRVKDTDTLVMLRALLLCCVMVASSGDFLRKRCITDLLPLLQEFLITQSGISEGKTARTGYLMTPQYQTQLRLLSGLLPQLLESLKLNAVQMIPVVNSVCCYLSTEQPPQLLQGAVTLLRQLSKTHPQIVWFALGHQLQPSHLQPPSCQLLDTVKVSHVLKHFPGL